MREVLLALCLLLMGVSCDSSISDLEGEWQISNDNRGFNYIFPISTISFQDSIALVIDQYGVLHTLNSECENSNLMLANDLDSLEYDVQVYDDSVRIDDILFVQHGSEKSKDRVEIELLNLPGKSLNLKSKRYNDFIVCLDRQNGLPVLRLNEIITDFEDLPIFLERRHGHNNKKRKRVVLFVDKEALYSDLLDVYYWLYASYSFRVFLVTKTNGLGAYEGFEDNIIFWEEDVVKYFERDDLLLSPMPFTKKEFFKSTENLNVIEDMDFEKIDEFKKLFQKRKSTVLMNVKKTISIKEYSKMMIAIKSHVVKVRNEEVVEKYGMPYDDLEIEHKREFWSNFTKHHIGR